MLLVLPGPGPARPRAQRRAARRAQRLRSPGSRAAEAKPRTVPAPTPLQEPDPGWGDRVPLEILLQIFGLLVAADGPIPFLGRYPTLCAQRRSSGRPNRHAAGARAPTHVSTAAVSQGLLGTPGATL